MYAGWQSIRSDTLDSAHGNLIYKAALLLIPPVAADDCFHTRESQFMIKVPSAITRDLLCLIGRMLSRTDAFLDSGKSFLLSRSNILFQF